MSEPARWLTETEAAAWAGHRRVTARCVGPLGAWMTTKPRERDKQRRSHPSQ
ncbi:hypothetical protein [Nocardia sp. NPDC050435]|uniref:hypothetical protein n=1 Tax=Nocardia sp. NPDC050435 TaxID=3155040 RepID=UPI0033FE141B